MINYLNDPHVQENWNIKPKEWKPCNSKVFEAYLSGKNSYYLLPALIKSNLRIVRFILFLVGVFRRFGLQNTNPFNQKMDPRVEGRLVTSDLEKLERMVGARQAHWIRSSGRLHLGN